MGERDIVVENGLAEVQADRNHRGRPHGRRDTIDKKVLPEGDPTQRAREQANKLEQRFQETFVNLVLGAEEILAEEK